VEFAQISVEGASRASAYWRGMALRVGEDITREHAAKLNPANVLGVGGSLVHIEAPLVDLTLVPGPQIIFKVSAPQVSEPK
jgi:hypothetical protein